MMLTNELPAWAQERLARELAAGESLRWADVAVPRFFSMATIAPMLFAVPWTAFAVFWICGASGFKMPDFSRGGFSFFPLFGVPFVLIGIGMLLSPVWRWLRLRRTLYAVTDRRAILFAGGLTRTVRSIAPDGLDDLCRRERRDGTGDVVFARRTWRDSDGDRRTEEIGFMSVRDPRTAEQQLRSLTAR